MTSLSNRCLWLFKGKLKYFVKVELNYRFFRKYQLNRFVRRHLSSYYTDGTPAAPNPDKWVVCMFDGKMRHGGLADRLRGIATAYQFCKEHQLAFKILHTHPYELTDFLLPGEYDWRVSPQEMSYAKSESRPAYISSHHLDVERDKEFQRKLSERELLRPCKQIHLYTNMYYADDKFAASMRELFKPSPLLAEALAECDRLIGGAYFSVSTRFIGLLGDFAEGKALPEDEQRALIDRCVQKVEELHRRHPYWRVLVTSDSQKFIDAVSHFDFVSLLPGEIGHIDKGEQKQAVHLKTFVDFFMISRAEQPIC